MNRDLFRRAEAVFAKVRDAPEDVRSVAIARECEGDPELLSEVRSLLDEQTRLGQFLNEPPAGGVARAALDAAAMIEDLSGTTLGSYRLVRKLNHGGMGAVYLAQAQHTSDASFVAIKVIKRGMDSDEILERFRRERRALASMDHPNIAKFIDASRALDGRPYFVMEHVPGLPIDEHCRQRRLSIEERLRLIAIVCRAVHHAHQNLVIHRDLKPSNIIVREDGTPKLLDFGIAKLLAEHDEDYQTAGSDQHRLTPEYASPEQLSGRPVTTASDVFSLGAIAFELLSERKPALEISGSGRQIRFSRTVTPPSAVVASESISIGSESPERWAARLRGDVDTIVLYAMREEPARRYVSAERFAVDIERHIAGQTVLARKDSSVYRARKFVRRHPVSSVLALALLLMLVVGSAALMYEAYAIRAQRDQAILARNEADAIADYLRELLASAAPQSDGPEARLYQVLESAIASARVNLRNQPRVLASVQTTIGRTYLKLGMVERAAPLIEQAAQMREQEFEQFHPDMIESALDLAELRLSQGRPEVAAKLARDAIKVLEAQGHSKTEIARGWNDLGRIYLRAGNPVAAESSHRRALEVQDQEYGRSSLDSAATLDLLAMALRAKGDVAGALANLTQSYRIRSALLSTDDRTVLTTRILHAQILLESKADEHSAEALAIATDLAPRCKRVFGVLHPIHGTALAILGEAQLRQGTPSEAVPNLRQALEIRSSRLLPGDSTVSATRTLLGIALVRSGQPVEGEALLILGIEGLQGEDEALDPSWHWAVDELIRVSEALGHAQTAARVRDIRFRRE